MEKLVSMLQVVLKKDKGIGLVQYRLAQTRVFRQYRYRSPALRLPTQDVAWAWNILTQHQRPGAAQPLHQRDRHIADHAAKLVTLQPVEQASPRSLPFCRRHHDKP